MSEAITISILQYIFGGGGFAIAALMYFVNRRERKMQEEKHRLEVESIKQDIINKQSEKRHSDLDYFKEQLETLKKLYTETQRANDEASKRKDIEIESIKKELEKIKESNNIIVQENKSIKLKYEALSKAYTRQIVDICKNHNCNHRDEATIEDIEFGTK